MEWVPTLPSHWRNTQLRRIARIFAGGTPDRTNLEYWTDGTVPWLNSGSVNDGSIKQPSEWITKDAAAGGRTRWVPASSVLVALAGQGKTKGMAARLEFASTCNQSMAAIVPTKNVDHRFIQFWLNANYRNIRNLAGGDLRDGLNLQHISGIKMPLPPEVEQKAIADYLDRETAEIDAFIADQEELIGLLNERRATTITQAVTKGLDPNTPMRESGIEWIGVVPASWTVEKLSWLARIGNGSTPATENPDFWLNGDVPWLNSSCVNLDVVLEPAKFVTAYAKRTCHLPMVRPGSILVGLTGQGKTRGMVTRLGIPSTINQHLAFIAPYRRLRSAFTYWFMVAAYDHLRFISDGNGGTKGGLTCDQLGRVQVPLPEIAEQIQIVAYIDREIAEIDAAVADAREAISLSKERRAAVISAAVTGKIDVSSAYMTERSTIQGESVGVA